MGEGEVRMMAQMYALVAAMEALKTRRDGMTAENLYRTSLGEYVAYSETDFIMLAVEIEGIVTALSQI